MNLVSQAMLADYERDGFLRIPRVFSKSGMNVIREAAYEALNVPTIQQSMQRSDGEPALIFWPQDVCDLLYAWSHTPKLREIVETVLGTSELRQLNNQIYFRHPGDGDEFAWHQDICFRVPREDFDDIENGYLQTVICVDDINASNAPVEYILGSHKDGERFDLVPRDGSERGLRTFSRDGRQGTKAFAEAGDVLIWHPLTIHGSEQNNSFKSRMLYMNGFARESALVNKDRFPRY